MLLGYGPVARLNPFQALLYSAFPAEGLAVSPVYDITTMPALTALRQQGYESVFHLHWTAQILRDATDEADAEHRADAFLAVVDEFVSAGGKLMWTVHNVLPHDVVFQTQQSRLQRELVERCWRVHVMSQDTRDRVADVCPIPAEKVVYSPHPAYQEAYPSYWTREEARATLGIEPGEIVLATFGAIKGYKGIARVLDVLDESWTHDAPWRLVLAGPPDRDPQTRELLRRAARHPRVILNAGKVRAEDVQIFLRAADVALVPYERSLNSGYLLLALTFGLPVIAPHGGGPADVVTPETGLLFDPASRDDLSRQLRELPVLVGPLARQAARERADQFTARLVSAEFARQLRKDVAL
ncbi:glycosyltransferase family 4 protein [Jiangella alkaliphila]|uniref:glycosyltransferase family 4 protein n=1 Tax=Jiangella alkaliphila TaxID=419479 RepID=UPI001364DE0C|nr:glycosyltransferase family 4 protein [Jiangella alkaliphila]